MQKLTKKQKKNYSFQYGGTRLNSFQALRKKFATTPIHHQPKQHEQAA